jgi:hypothetical protein
MNDPKIPLPLDEQFRLEASATNTASYNSATFDLGAGVAFGGIGQEYAAVSNVTALKLSSGNETYSHKLQHSDDGSTWVDAGGAIAITATGVQFCTGVISKRYVRRAVTLGGTTPNITSDAILSPMGGV